MSQKEQRITIAITITVVVVALASLLVSVERKHEADREMARIQEETRERQAKQKAEQPEVVKLTPAELNAKRDAELEESRRKSEESKRHLEETLAARKAQEEQYIAREQELAASRISVDEFNAQFLAALNTERMTEPTKRTTNGAIETVTYPFDHTGELFLTEVSSFGAIKSVLVSVEKINGDNMNVAWLVYAAAVQIFTSMNDLDYIFTQLKLYPADVAVADLKNSRSVQVGNYRFQKNAGSNSVSFSIVDTR